MKQRVMVIGAAGFVGSAIVKQLDSNLYQVIAVSRKDCDLADDNSRTMLAELVQDGDVVVCAAAKAPAVSSGSPGRITSRPGIARRAATVSTGS